MRLSRATMEIFVFWNAVFAFVHVAGGVQKGVPEDDLTKMKRPRPADDAPPASANQMPINWEDKLVYRIYVNASTNWGISELNTLCAAEKGEGKVVGNYDASWSNSCGGNVVVWQTCPTFADNPVAAQLVSAGGAGSHECKNQWNSDDILVANIGTNDIDCGVNAGSMWALSLGGQFMTSLPSTPNVPVLCAAPHLMGHGHGDPHLTNMKGEDFDVMQEGKMLLLETPRQSTPDTLNFGLRADIERLGAAKCGPTYITKLQMEGSWIGHLVQMQSGKVVEKPEMHDKNAFGIRIDDADWVSHASFMELFKRKGYLELASGAMIHTEPRMFLVKVKGLKILVSQPKRPRVFLDVQIKGIETLSGEVGGLLGIDDHSEVEELPGECVNQIM